MVRGIGNGSGRFARQCAQRAAGENEEGVLQQGKSRNGEDKGAVNAGGSGARWILKDEHVNQMSSYLIKHCDLPINDTRRSNGQCLQLL